MSPFARALADLGTGSPLPTALRRHLESRLGADLSRVRLHVGASSAARQLGASAFTVGRHIIIADPGFRPHQPDAFRLLSHEATHAIQQGLHDPPAGPLEVDPDPMCEAEAVAAERGPLTPVRRIAPAVQRHQGPFCPNCPLPQWIEIGAGDRAVWLPVNQAIEAAYLASHSSNAILFGSQFESGGFAGRDTRQGTIPSTILDIQVPKGVPNKKMADAILAKLRGNVKQLAPDIIDFTDRVVYEIKTAGTAQAGRVYLDGIYPLLDAITNPMGGPNFNRSFATWVPPQVFPLPGDATKRVCTAASTIPTRTDGLILYQVYRRTNQEEEAEAIRKAVVLSDLNPALNDVRDRVGEGLVRVAVGKPTGTDLWIIASPEFYQTIVMKFYQAQMQRKLDMMRVQGGTARENPLLALRTLGWAAAAITLAPAGIVFLVFSGGGIGLAAGEATAAGVVGGGAAAAAGTGGTAAAAAAGGTAAGGEMAVYSLAAYRAAKAAQVAVPVVTQAAAGVLLVVSTVSVARAEGNPATVTKTGSVRAVPANAVGPDGVTYEMDRKVSYDGQDYYVVGRASVR